MRRALLHPNPFAPKPFATIVATPIALRPQVAVVAEHIRLAGSKWTDRRPISALRPANSLMMLSSEWDALPSTEWLLHSSGGSETPALSAVAAPRPYGGPRRPARVLHDRHIVYEDERPARRRSFEDEHGARPPHQNRGTAPYPWFASPSCARALPAELKNLREQASSGVQLVKRPRRRFS